MHHYKSTEILLASAPCSDFSIPAVDFYSLFPYEGIRLEFSSVDCVGGLRSNTAMLFLSPNKLHEGIRGTVTRYFH